MNVFSPAKINLFLAITGRRADGFHELVSVVAPLAFGDDLVVEPGAGAADTLRCDEPAVPVDSSNLVLRAAEVFREASGRRDVFNFSLTKRVPMGAGLGGGSSNATAALRAMNALTGSPLDATQMEAAAARLGSDCVLFLRETPLIMRGRGERLEALPPAAAERLSGRRVLLFKPAFGIATAWAYAQLAKDAPSSYLPAGHAEARLRAWLDAAPGTAAAAAENLLFNNMEPPAFRKFLALPTLLGNLRREFGLAVGMSGSGSACLALLPDDFSAESALCARIRDAWGDTCFLEETRIR